MSADYERFLGKKFCMPIVVALAEEIFKLRKMLWLNHGHTEMYGNDGEMQCGECVHEYGFYDWKRTDINEIEAKMTKANMKKLADQPTN